jgi:P2-related tail formation protein
MPKLTKKEKREMIAAAMKTISEHKGLSPASKDRGVVVLGKALLRNSDPR